MGKQKSAGTAAVAALTAAGVPHTLHPYDHDPREQHFGDEVVRLLGLDPARVFKTLLAVGDRQLVCALVPVAAKLDLKALATAAGAKRLAMADPAAAERSSGYRVGGISPLGQRTRLPTFADRSVLDTATVWVSGGRRGLQIELAGADLVALTEAQVLELAR